MHCPICVLLNFSDTISLSLYNASYVTCSEHFNTSSIELSSVLVSEVLHHFINDMKVYLSQYYGSSQLNQIFLPTGLRGVLEVKSNMCLDSVFPFVFIYAENWIVFQENAPSTRIHVLETDTVNSSM